MRSISRVASALALIWLLVALAGCTRGAPLLAPTAGPPSNALPQDAAGVASALPSLAVPVLPAPTIVAPATPSPSLESLVAEGRRAVTVSNFAAAERLYREALALDDGYAPAHAALGELYRLLTGWESEAMREARAAVDLAPTGAAGYITLAGFYIDRQDAPQAVQAAEQAARADPASPAAQTVLASAYLLDGRSEPARAALQRALQLDPQSAAAYAALAALHDAEGDYGRGLAALDRAAALERRNVLWPLRRGQALARLGRFDEAEEQLAQAARLAPGFVPVILARAGAAMRRQTYFLAASLAEKARRLQPASAAPRSAQGRLALLQGDLAGAAASYGEALAQAPDDVEARLGLARVRLAQGDCQAASELFQALAAARPRLAAALLGQAAAAACLGERPRALDLATQAAGLAPCSAEAYNLVGELQAADRRWDEARTAYVNAWRCSPTGADVQAGFGKLYLAQGDLAAAADAFLLARRLDPRQAGSEAGLCEIYLRTRDVEPALRECAAAADLAPGDRVAGERRAQALLLAGKYQEAVDRLKPMLAGNWQGAPASQSSQSHHYLGVAYLGLGDYAAAREEFAAYEPAAVPSGGPGTQDGESDERLAVLLDGLTQGWKLPRAALEAALTKAAMAKTGRQVKVLIPEDEPAATGEPPVRSLVIGYLAPPHADAEQTAGTMLALLKLAGLYAPRLDPPVTGNVVAIVLDGNGRAAFGLAARPAAARAFALLLATSGDFTQGLVVLTGSDFAGMEALSDAEVRDITGQVAELRGLKAPDDVRFVRLDREAFARARLAHEIDEAPYAANQQAIARLLGRTAPDADLASLEAGVAAERTAGFYDPADHTFNLIQGAQPDWQDRVTVAHEYVHVLQDQNFRIDFKMSTVSDEDQAMALRALAEGDASLAEAIYEQRQMPVQDRTYRAALGRRSGPGVLEGVPSFLRDELAFPYTAGMQFVEQMRGNSGWQAVDALYARPPASTEQVLHPDLYRQDHRPLTVTLPYLAGKLGGGWREADYGVIGELGWRVTLAQTIGVAPAGAAAAGWGGDRYALLHRSAGDQDAAVFASTWDSAGEAAEYALLLRTSLDHRTQYAQVTDDLLSGQPLRRWSQADAAWILWQNGRQVIVIVAPTAEVATQMLRIGWLEALQSAD